MSRSRSADAIARDHTEEALGVMRTIMNDEMAKDQDRLRAATELIDRGYGRAVSAVIAVPAARATQAKLANMTDEELMEAIRSEPLPRLMAPGFSCPLSNCPGDHRSEDEYCGEVETEEDPLLR